MSEPTTEVPADTAPEGPAPLDRMWWCAAACTVVFAAAHIHLITQGAPGWAHAVMLPMFVLACLAARAGLAFYEAMTPPLAQAVSDGWSASRASTMASSRSMPPSWIPSADS